MLKPRKRLTRKQIRQDKFITTVMKLAGTIQRNSKRFAIGTAVVLVAVVVVVVITQHRKRQQVQATEVLGEAQMAKWVGETDEVEKLYQRVTQQFGGTRSSGEAWVALGNLYFKEGQVNEAKTAFQRYLKKYSDDPILTYTAWSGIAACLEEEGRYSEAAQKHRSFADRHQDSAWATRALWDACRCFRLSGEFQEAKMVLQQIIDLYPDSPLAYRAKSEEKMLE
ncbi:MAG: tetratricopeptide repeat protein [Candidatus Latescibacteria bacterium]|nr:tetratricopeptide repeat protein [Candidatus Latescibacterota bacterium]